MNRAVYMVLLAICCQLNTMARALPTQTDTSSRLTTVRSEKRNKLSQVKSLLEAGDIDSARKLLIALKNSQHTEEEFWCLFSELYSAEGEFDLALEAAEKAYTRNTSSARTIKLYGEMACLNGRFKLAEQLCKKLSLIAGHELEASLLMVRICRMSYRYDQAITEITKLIEKFPNNIDYRELRAELLMHRSKWKLALRDLNEIEKSKELKSRTRIYRLKARCHLYAHEYHSAVEYASRVLRSFPRDPVALQIRAKSYKHLGKHAQAKQDREKGKTIVDDTDIFSGN
ncbi:MAG: tetratricopeptide repeat protein [Candidatus Melainabacteria bacterium]|nr:tetratricopeptide repeat protein [Candidatus Melainabacteria bacterium]